MPLGLSAVGILCFLLLLSKETRRSRAVEGVDNRVPARGRAKRGAVIQAEVECRNLVHPCISAPGDTPG